MSYSIKKSVVAVMLFMAVSVLFAPSAAIAKTTSNPNDKGWTGKFPKLKPVYWKPIQAKCDKCTRLVENYNNVVENLFEARLQIKRLRSLIANEKKVSGKKKDSKNKSKSRDINANESQAVAEKAEIFEVRSQALEKYKQLTYMLEQHASYLRQVIIKCEQTACEKPQKVKLKDIEIGGLVPSTPWQPDIAGILKLHKVDWRGPYRTNCKPCLPIIHQLNAVPGWITRAHLDFQRSRSLYELRTGVTSSESPLVETRNLVKIFENLKAQLAECEQKHCPSTDNQPISTCPDPAAGLPINVGLNADIGSSANFKEKAKKQAAGLATKAITGLLGIGGGGGGKSAGPGTYKDPVKNKYKTKVKSKKPRREIRAGAIFTEDGLLVSTDIKKAPGKGTFQAVYLENQRGWRLYPIALFMYEIWQDWKLSVSWTRSTYVDGNLVSRETGGWTESWRELIAKGEALIYGLVQGAPLWEQLGFNTAVSGARSLGTLFPVSPQMLANEPINLVIHVTTPKSNPVMTVPYIFQLSLDKRGRVQVEHVEQTMASTKEPCEEQNKITSSSKGAGAVDQLPVTNIAANDNGSVNNVPANQNGPIQSPQNQSVDNTSSGNTPSDADKANTDQTASNGSSLDKSGDDSEGGSPPAASTKTPDPCKDDCAKLRGIAEQADKATADAQAKADQAKAVAKSADSKAQQAEDAADKADDMARDIPRDDHAIINGHKYTTADTEYRIKLQGEINARHKAGEISDAEHEKQTKANTNKKAQEERLKNLKQLREKAAETRAAANAARKAANDAKQAAADAQTLADQAKAKAKDAHKVYQDCLKKAKEECEKIKAAEAKQKAELAAAAARREAEIKADEKRRQQAAKAKATKEARAKANRKEDERLLAMIRKLGLIDKKVGDVPSLWQWLPDILETPVSMLAEQASAVPIPTDTLKAIGGLYGLAAAMLNPCTKAGIQKTEGRLREMINSKTGRLYTETEAAVETSAMCSLLGRLRGKINAAKNAAKQ